MRQTFHAVLVLFLTGYAVYGQEPVLTLQGHGKPVVDVLASADGKYLASMGSDGETIVWNLAEQHGKRVASEKRDLGESEGRYLHFTRESEPVLFAGTWGYSLAVDPVTGKSLGELGWKYYLNKGNLVPLAGRSVLSLNKASEMEAAILGRPDSKTKLKLYATDSHITWLPSPDGQLLLTNNYEGASHVQRSKVNVLKSPSFAEHTILQGFPSPVNSFSWLPDGRVVVLEDNGTITLWNVSGKARLLAKLTNQEHDAGASHLAVSPDGKKIVYYGKNETRILELTKTSGKLITRFAGSGPYVFSADGSILLARSPSTTIQAIFVDASTGATLSTYDRRDKQTWPRFTHDGKHYLVGHGSGKVTMHAIGSGAGSSFTLLANLECIAPSYEYDGRLMHQSGMFRSFEGTIQFSPDHSVVALRDNYRDDVGRLSIARIDTSKEQRGTWKRSSSGGRQHEKVRAHSVALLSDNRVFIEAGQAAIATRSKDSKNNQISIAGDSGTVNPMNGEYVSKRQNNIFYSGMQASPDGTKVVSIVHRAGQQPQLELLDAQTGRTLQVVMESPPSSAHTPQYAFSSNGERIAARINKRLFVFDLKTKEQLPLLDDQDHSQFHLIDEGKILVYVYQDKIIGINLDDNSKAFSWEANRLQAGQVIHIDFSLDGRYAICGSTLGEISIRQARTGQVLGQLKVFDKEVQHKEVKGVGISADGTQIAAANYDRRLLVWKLNITGKEADHTRVITVE